MTTHTAARPRTPRPAPFSISVRRSIALGVVLLGCIAVYGGGRLLVAGIAHYQAQAFLKHWAQSLTQPSEHAWNVAERAIQRALHAYPGSNGEYLETLGHINQWRAFGVDLTDTSVQPYRDAAVQALRDATQARPTWPDAWAALAYAKLTTLTFDDEFSRALHNAQHFGPWRIGINRRIAEIGLIAYAVLTPEQRTRVNQSIQRTAQYSTTEHNKLRALAQQTHQLSAFEAALQTQPQPQPHSQ